MNRQEGCFYGRTWFFFPENFRRVVTLPFVISIVDPWETSSIDYSSILAEYVPVSSLFDIDSSSDRKNRVTRLKGTSKNPRTREAYNLNRMTASGIRQAEVEWDKSNQTTLNSETCRNGNCVRILSNSSSSMDSSTFRYASILEASKLNSAMESS